MPTTLPIQLPSGRIEEQPHLTPGELADMLHVARKTVYRRVEAGLWPHVRVSQQVYFSPSDVAAIMAAARREPTTRRAPGLV